MVDVVMITLRTGAKRNGARGAALVEFAVVAPLLFTLIFGIMEYGYLFMVRGTAQHAAREAARVATLRESTETQVLHRVDEIMSTVGLGSDKYSRTLELLPDGENPTTARVEVTVPIENISLIGNFFTHSAGPINGECSMQLEGVLEVPGSS